MKLIWFLTLLVAAVFLAWQLLKPVRQTKSYSVESVIQLGVHRIEDHSVAALKEFAEALINEYSRIIDTETNSAFRNQFRLWKDALSVKAIFSRFSECLIYIYPSEKRQVLIEFIDLPVQTSFLNGLIDFERPDRVTDTSLVRLTVPHEEAIRYYAETPGRMGSESSGIRITGEGTWRFKDVEKMLTLPKDTLFGFYNHAIKVDNTSPAFVQTYGRPVSFELKLKGPLLFAAAIDFSLVHDDAKKLGRQLAESDIKVLFEKSEFFRQSRAHSVLETKASEIAQKYSRTRTDPSYEYPLWEFKKDLFELKAVAQKSGVDASYVDDLLKVTAVQDGHLVWYYPNRIAFMWQWVGLNVVLLCFLLVFQLVQSHNPSAWPSMLSTLKTLKANVWLPLLPFVINSWAFYRAPVALTVVYWLLPGALFLISGLWTVILFKDL